MLQEFLPLQSLCLLYAEDDDDVRESTARVLAYYFTNIKIAKDGQEALQIYEKEQIDILMLDVKMPHKSGLDVASSIRLHNSNIPIILVSSYHEYQDLLLAIRLHIIDYLLKPFDLSSLNHALRLCMNKLSSKNTLLIPLSETISYNKETKTLLKDNESLSLSKSENCILELLLAQRGKVVSYQEIEIALGREDVTLAAIKNIVLRLRKKLKNHSIENVLYYGYILR